MPELNADVPLLYVDIRAEYLYDLKSHQGEFVPACVFGVASIPGRALGFHALTETGAQIARLPITALVSKRDAPTIPLDHLQLWDCLSDRVVAHEYEFLRELRCRTVLKDKTWHFGRYCFTLDWHGSEQADSPGDNGHKCAHVIALDNGCFAAQPNNRCQFFEPALVLQPFQSPPGYLTNTHVWKVEAFSKWRAEDTPEMFYGVVPDDGT